MFEGGGRGAVRTSQERKKDFNAEEAHRGYEEGDGKKAA
jgi:hypothetical protein